MEARRRLFLDHNAGTAADPRVLERFLAVERTCPANPSSLHEDGRRARHELEAARERVAAALGVAADDVVFTSGGTEANNLAVLGLGDRDRPVLASPCEHASVLEPARLRGIVEWQVDPSGRAVVSAPATAVGLISLVHGQSEVGSIQDIAGAAALATAVGVPLHVDAAQTLGRLPLADVVAAADSVALAPHKAGGLRGAGVLWVRRAAERLRPLLRGGGQERGLRPGTTSPALAAATALAIELAVREQTGRAQGMAAARDAFLATLLHANILCRVLTPKTSLPNTALLHVVGVDGRSLLPALDLAGISVSQGSACASGSPLPPRVLTAMGLDDAAARSCVRVSFGCGDEVGFAQQAAHAFGLVIARLQKKI